MTMRRWLKRTFICVFRGHRWVIFEDSWRHKLYALTGDSSPPVGTLAACAVCGQVHDSVPSKEEDAAYAKQYKIATTPKPIDFNAVFEAFTAVFGVVSGVVGGIGKSLMGARDDKKGE